MITIKLNDQAIQIDPNFSLMELLNHFQYDIAHIAIALNRDFIPKIRYEITKLREGDEIEIVTPMQGG